MPESVTDRCTKAHEYIFLLTKAARYYFDCDALREPHQDAKVIDGKYTGLAISAADYEERKWLESCDGSKGNRPPITMKNRVYNPAGRNRRSVWTITPKPYREAHFATFPPEIPRLCISAGSRPGDTVLDPFAGSGTTGMVALELGRVPLLVELKAEYCEMAQTRCGGRLCLSSLDTAQPCG